MFSNPHLFFLSMGTAEIKQDYEALLGYSFHNISYQLNVDLYDNTVQDSL